MRAACFILLFAGCATPYRQLGWGGGYRDRQLNAGLYEIEVRGNGFTDQWTLEDYFNRRAAELCGAEGFSAFRSEMEATSRTAPSDYTIRSDGRGNARIREHIGPTKHIVRGVVQCVNEASPPTE